MVGSGNPHPIFLDLLHLLVQHGLGLPPEPLGHLLVVNLISPDGMRTPDGNHMQLRVRAVGQVDGRPESQVRLLRTVSGQKDFRREDTHLLLLYISRATRFSCGNPLFSGASDARSSRAARCRTVSISTSGGWDLRIRTQEHPSFLLLARKGVHEFKRKRRTTTLQKTIAVSPFSCF